MVIYTNIFVLNLRDTALSALDEIWKPLLGSRSDW